MDEKKAEQLDKLLKKLKDKRYARKLFKNEEIVALLDLNNHDEIMVLKTKLVEDGYLDSERSTWDSPGIITDEGIAFITEGGYKSLLKNFSDNKELEALKNENIQLQNENLKLQNKSLKQRWLFFIIGALSGIICVIIAGIMSKS